MGEAMTNDARFALEANQAYLKERVATIMGVTPEGRLKFALNAAADLAYTVALDGQEIAREPIPSVAAGERGRRIACAKSLARVGKRARLALNDMGHKYRSNFGASRALDEEEGRAPEVPYTAEVFEKLQALPDKTPEGNTDA